MAFEDYSSQFSNPPSLNVTESKTLLETHLLRRSDDSQISTYLLSVLEYHPSIVFNEQIPLTKVYIYKFILSFASSSSNDYYNFIIPTETLTLEGLGTFDAGTIVRVDMNTGDFGIDDGTNLVIPIDFDKLYTSDEVLVAGEVQHMDNIEWTNPKWYKKTYTEGVCFSDYPDLLREVLAMAGSYKTVAELMQAIAQATQEYIGNTSTKIKAMDIPDKLRGGDTEVVYNSIPELLDGIAKAVQIRKGDSSTKIKAVNLPREIRSLITDGN